MIPLGDRLPRRHFPLATAALLVVEVAVFVVVLRLPAVAQTAVVERWALIPAKLAPLLAGDLAAAPAAARLVSCLLLHAGVLHLAGNLLFLWVFGRAVEEAMGSGRFVSFFLLCGALSGLVDTLVHPASTVPTVGASGAISGVLGAYLALYPRARVRSVVLLVFVPLTAEVPAALWLLAWLALQLFEAARSLAANGNGNITGVAWWAHLGGFAAGLLLHRFFRRAATRRK